MTDVSKELLPLVEECEHGHKFGKLPDHPKRDGLDRCPHCMAQGLDATRAQPAPADVVEAVTFAISPHLQIVESDDPEAWRDYARLVAKAAISAIPVSGEVERLREENQGLKHDLDRYMKIANIECNEAERLRKALRDLLTAVEAADSTKRGDFYHERKAARQALTPPRSIRVSDLTDEEVEEMRKPSA